MTPFRRLLLSLLSVFCLGAGPLCPDHPEFIVEARTAASQFMQALKGRLAEALHEKGAPQAIRICSEVAPRIAAEISRQRGWEVGRTSLQLRNPANLAEAWEAKVLREFAAARAEGADPAELEYCALVELDGSRRLRYMKAIPTEQVCLQCHGRSLATKVEQALAEKYPHDRATGYARGEIRGALSIEAPLRQSPKAN